MIILKVFSTMIASMGIFSLFYAFIHDEVMGFIVSPIKKRKPYLTRMIFLGIIGLVGFISSNILIWI